jgi:hypothetical protein
MSPTYTTYWRSANELKTIEKYVEKTLDGVEQERIVSISHAMADIGGSARAVLTYSVLVTIRDLPVAQPH